MSNNLTGLSSSRAPPGTLNILIKKSCNENSQKKFYSSVNGSNIVISVVILGNTHLEYFICHCILSIPTLDIDICLRDPLDQDVSAVVHLDLAALGMVIVRFLMMFWMIMMIIQSCSYCKRTKC